MVRSASKRPPSTLKQTDSVPCARWMPSCSRSVVMAVAGRPPAPHDGCRQMDLVNSGSAYYSCKIHHQSSHVMRPGHDSPNTAFTRDTVFTRDTHWRTRTGRDNIAFTFDTLRQRIIKCNVHTRYRLAAIHQQRFT